VDRDSAFRKWRALCNITVERGATTHEATTAFRLARALAAKFGFSESRPADFRPDFDHRYARAEARAARRWKWEYRQCYKPRCHCMKFHSPHGPYKYGKQRTGHTVRSVYMGK
jgi:hypothetical protein